MKYVKCAISSTHLTFKTNACLHRFTLQGCFEEQKAGGRPLMAKCTDRRKSLREPCYEAGAHEPKFKAGPARNTVQRGKLTDAPSDACISESRSLLWHAPRFKGRPCLSRAGQQSNAFDVCNFAGNAAPSPGCPLVASYTWRRTSGPRPAVPPSNGSSARARARLRVATSPCQRLPGQRGGPFHQMLVSCSLLTGGSASRL